MPLAAIGQLTSTTSLSHNLAQANRLARLAHARKASTLFLPEASDYIAPTAAESLALCQPATSSPFIRGLCATAAQYRLPICVGVHEPASEPPSAAAADEDEQKHTKKINNTLLYIDEEGTISHHYTKLHLFDVDLSSSTPPGPTLTESATVSPGHSLTPPIPTPIGPLGLLICFDLRFPEPALALRARGAQILTYPSAFTVPTGRAHWEVLLRARAIETQCWVIAAAQVGRHDEGGKRRSWGHGVVIDPWGRVVLDLGGEEGDGGERVGEQVFDEELGVRVGFAEIDLGVVEKVRREVPLVRRTDVYPEIK